MMKKLIALFLLLSILAFPAMAEPFTLRQGVRFGMSKAEVQQVEGSEGREQPKKGKLIYDVLDQLEGVPVGRASAETLYYKFSSDQLWEVQFWSGYYETEAEAQAAFDTWEALVETEYGDCLDAEAPVQDTSCLRFYKDLSSNFDEKCVCFRKLGLTVDGEQIVVDLFILPSMEDFHTFCAFDCPAYAPAGTYN